MGVAANTIGLGLKGAKGKGKAYLVKNKMYVLCVPHLPWYRGKCLGLLLNQTNKYFYSRVID